MLKYYLTLAWRNICRQKIQSLLSIVGLAVALFCFGIFSYLVYSFLFVDTWYENHDRVVQISQVDDDFPLLFLPPRTFALMFQQLFLAVSRLAAWVVTVFLVAF